jgi:PAS domain S-box-containing protein
MQGCENVEPKSKILSYINFFIEKNGSFILNLFSAAIGIRLFFAMDAWNDRFGALFFGVTFLLASIYRKKTHLFFPLITISTLTFTLLTIYSQIDFYTLLSLANHFLVITAFLLLNPFFNILFGGVFSSLLLTYQDTPIYYLKGSIVELAVDTLFYSLFAHLIRYLYRKKGELQESQESNELLLSLVPDPLVIHQKGRVIFINQVGLKLFGAKDLQELAGKSVFDYVLPEYHKNLAERIKLIYSLKQSSKPLEIKITNLKDSILDIEISGVLINYQGSPAVLTMVRDITAQKSQTAELIQKSDKLSLVGQLAAGIAHEIRNPLTSLRGFIQLLGYKSEDNKEYCEIMLSELDRINLIVGEFLILAKPHMVNFSNKDINSIIRHVGTLIGTQAIINNIHIDYQLAKNLPAIPCEENQLKQVIINLIKNAIEAMPTGGTISVETGQRDAEHIYIRITDEGKGIPEEVLSKLGEPFYTTKEHGTGLGLMVCYKIIENHLGQLNVTSKMNEGSSFEIMLAIEKVDEVVAVI